MAAAKRGEAGSLAILAERQIAGRGREGRSWVGAPGNLFVSVLLRSPGAPPGACWAELAGVALFDAVAAAAGAAGLSLKHPNDLLLRGAKLGGLLVDTALSAEGALDWVVIGAGVNIAHAPTLADRRTAALGAGIAPEALAAGFARELQRGLDAGWVRVHAVWAERTGMVVA